MNRNDCPCRTCPEQGCGRHAECKQYMEYWEEKRARNKERLRKKVTDDYTVLSIQKARRFGMYHKKKGRK